MNIKLNHFVYILLVFSCLCQLEVVPNKRLIPYPSVQEADVLWSKRVWQQIDLREKINLPLYYPEDNYDAGGNWQKSTRNWSLWTVLKTHILSGEIRIFSPYNPLDFTIKDGDQLKYPIDPEPGKDYYTDQPFHDNLFYFFGTLSQMSDRPLSTNDGQDSTVIENGIISFVYPPRDTIWYVSKDIIQYHIKEDWYFDKERSSLEVRIMAIAPVIYEKDVDGQITGTRELFWIYFPHARYVLNSYYVFNEHNDVQWLTYDDLFWKRRFSASIYKESNAADSKIEQYMNGIEALYESNRIREEIRMVEEDLWRF